MNALVVTAIVIAVVLLAMNVYVTYLLAKSEFFEPVQKYIQYALIWLLPVIGAVICYLFVQPALGRSNQSVYDDEAAFVSGNDGYAGPHHYE